MNNKGWFAFAVVLVLALAGVMIAYSEMSEEPDEGLPICEYSCFGFRETIDGLGLFVMDTSVKGTFTLYLDGKQLGLTNPVSDSIYSDGSVTVYLMIPDGKTLADLKERIEARMIGYECVRVS